jgi:Phosphotransferase enzyme family
MSALAALPDLNPLASASLRLRFPHLSAAMDGAVMRPLLQRLLLDGTELVADGCDRPKAEVSGNFCWLQYPLQVRRPSGDHDELLVLGVMFAEPDGAATFERDVLAPLAARLPKSAGAAPTPTGVLEPLRMAVSVFPVNGLLPTLVDAANPQRVTEVLRSIPDVGHDRRVAGIDLLRLRRTRGCVLRYRLEPPGDRAVVYGKIGPGAPPEIVREGLDALAQSVPADRRASILFPRVLGRSAELDLTFIASVPGSRPDLHVDSVVDTIVDRAALVAATMHSSGVTVGFARTLEVELDRAKQAVGMIRQDAPAVAEWLTAVTESLTPVARRMPSQRLSLSHGDFTPSQLLLDGSRIAVLDFDRLCQAESAFDLGRFLAYFRVALARSGHGAGDGLTARFKERYRAAGGQATEDDRIEVYGIASLVRMAAHSCQQLKPARLRLVCTVLERAVERLGLG